MGFARAQTSLNLTMSKVHVLSAAALVAAKLDPTFWEYQRAGVVLHVVDKNHATTEVFIDVSVRQTIAELLQAVEDAEGRPVRNTSPALTVIFAPASDAGTFAKGRASTTVVVVLLDKCDNVTNIPCASFLGESWAVHRLSTTLNALRNLPVESQLEAIPFISPEEQQLLLNWSRALPSDQSLEHLESPLIHHYFEKIARQLPDAIALQSETDTLTYRELDRKSSTLAAFLVHEFHIVPGDLILLFFDKSFEMVIAILAVVSFSLHNNWYLSDEKLERSVEGRRGICPS